MDFIEPQVASGGGVTGPERTHNLESNGRVRVVEAPSLPWFSAEMKACLGLT